MADTLAGDGGLRTSFQATDYRYSEFSSAASHALFVTCVEIMSLSGEPADIAHLIINVVTKNLQCIPRGEVERWLNAAALILANLPDSYSNVLTERIIELLEGLKLNPDPDIFSMFDFNSSHAAMIESEMSYLLALWHTYWGQGTIGRLCSLSTLLKERLKPIVETEDQFIFVCHLVCPFLHRFLVERTRCVMDITIELYEILEVINHKCDKLKHINIISDLLYHLKYQFTGDHIKKDIEKPIQNMKGELNRRLRFISNIAQHVDAPL